VSESVREIQIVAAVHAAGNDDADLHPSARRRHERVAGPVVGDEVGVADQDLLAGGGDRQQVHEANAGAALARRAAEHLALHLARRLQHVRGAIVPDAVTALRRVAHARSRPASVDARHAKRSRSESSLFTRRW